MTTDRPLPPILLLVFNRPAVLRQMVDALRVARPPVLYVSGDGPRNTNPDDVARCTAVRDVIAQAIDWPCAVHTWFRDTNVGLQRAVTTSIDWFFTHETAGVILEDDCLPSVDFLPFAGEMLERYAETPSVMHISGASLRTGGDHRGPSYGFAQAGHVWGWATWRRAWAHFDPTLSAWPDVRLAYRNSSCPLRRALGRKYAAAHSGRQWTWSRAWHWSTMQQHALSVIPYTNFIRNIGQGTDATHRRSLTHPLLRSAMDALRWPLVHPPQVVTDPEYDDLLATYHRGSYRRQLTDHWWALRERVP